MRILKRLGFVVKGEKADMLFMDARVKPKHDIPSVRHTRPRSGIRDNNAVLHNTCPPRRFAEVGRSMVEMLGVLAVIGVLSMAAVAGYRFAVTKHRVNEITQALDLKAVELSAEILSETAEAGRVLIDSDSAFVLGQYPVSAQMAANNSDYFQIELSGISGDVCRLILNDYATPVVMFANQVHFTKDADICSADDLNTMRFLYKNDLDFEIICGQYAAFDADELACQCRGNTWFDDASGGCRCPSGKIWSEENETCIDSVCESGYFESLNNGCISCDDSAATYTISATQRAIDVCNACPNRSYVNAYGLSNCQVDCASDEFYDYAHRCYSCHTVNNVGMVKDKASCEACGNRVLFDAENCIHKDYCGGVDKMAGTYFFASLTANTTRRDCTLCSDSARSVEIANIKDSVDLCNACPNRVAVGKYCIRSTCLSDEFQGADGACYACDEIKSIAIEDNETAKAACLACAREVTDDLYCRVAACTAADGGLRMDDGTCYRCDRQGWGMQFKVSSEAEKAACLACGNRYISGTGYCMHQNNCGTNYFDDSSGWCRSCSDKGSFSVGTTYSYAWERCKACSDRHITSDAYCVLETACAQTQFVSSTGGCVSCSVADGKIIGTGEEERQRCLSCSDTKRFWNGKTCYPCSIEAALPTTDEAEEDSCLTCPNRYVDEDGQCRLVQSGGSLQ